MKTAHLAISLSVFVMLAAGCGILPRSDVSRAQSVAELIAAQQFAQAKQQINRAKPEDQDYAQLQQQLPEIDRQAQVYAEQVLQNIESLQQRNEWELAKQACVDALAKLPAELPARAQLAERYRLLLQARTDYINDQHLQLSLRLGEYLLEEGPYLERIYNADPSSLRASWEWSSYQRKRREIARTLSTEGMKALNDGRYYIARRYLALSQQLSPDPHTDTMLTTAREEIASRQLSKQQAREERYQVLLNRYKMLKSAEDYNTARATLSSLLKLKPGDKQLLAEQAELNAGIALIVSRAILDGEAHYSNGNVGKALAVWRQAAELAPENSELQQRVERAEKFLENYQSLLRAVK